MNVDMTVPARQKECRERERVEGALMGVETSCKRCVWCVCVRETGEKTTTETTRERAQRRETTHPARAHAARAHPWRRSGGPCVLEARCLRDTSYRDGTRLAQTRQGRFRI